MKGKFVTVHRRFLGPDNYQVCNIESQLSIAHAVFRTIHVQEDRETACW